MAKNSHFPPSVLLFAAAVSFPAPVDRLHSANVARRTVARSAVSSLRNAAGAVLAAFRATAAACTCPSLVVSRHVCLCTGAPRAYLANCRACFRKMGGWPRLRARAGAGQTRSLGLSSLGSDQSAEVRTEVPPPRCAPPTALWSGCMQISAGSQKFFFLDFGL